MANVQCPVELVIGSVASLHDELRDALASGDATLHAADVTRIDTAGVQLLLSFVQTARARGLTPLWQPPPSAALIAAARTLGLTAALGLEG